MMKEFFLIFLKGMLMGAADIVPGVSGGTMALITGIYSRLVNAINSCTDFLKTFDFKKIDFQLFIPLLLGIGISIIAFSNVIHYFLESQRVLTYSFFFGLILASVLFLYKKLKPTKQSALYGLFGAIFGYSIIGLGQMNANHSLPVIFVSAMIAITAMILPGISGSFMLLIMGQYEYIIAAIKSLDFFILGVFCLGALIGILAFAKLLKHLLSKHENVTFSFLVGLMLGSLRLPAEIMMADFSYRSIIWALLGFILVLMLEKKV